MSADKAWDMIEGFRTCMMVTNTGAILRSRPMTPQARKDESVIYFLARRDGGKDDEIIGDGQVNLAFSEGQQHVSVSGVASISASVDLKQRLWGPFAQAFLPEGPNSEKTIVIVVHPHQAEYWDGDNAVVQFFKMGAALLTGREPDLGANVKTYL